MEKELIEILAVVLGKTEAEVTELLQSEENRKKNVLDIYKASLKDVKTLAHQKGFDEAKAKTLDELETEVKSKFDFQSDKKGLGLIESLVEAKASKNSGGEPASKEVTEDDVKTHPLYLKAVREADKLKEEKTTIETKTAERLQKQWEEEKRQKEDHAEAERKFLEFGPVLPEDKTKRENRLNDSFRTKLNNFKFERQDDGSRVVMKKKADGSFALVENEYGRPKPFDEFIKDLGAEAFDYKVSTDRSSLGTGGDKGDKSNMPAGRQHYSGPIPSTRQEAADFIKKASSTDEALEIKSLFDASQKK